MKILQRGQVREFVPESLKEKELLSKKHGVKGMFQGVCVPAGNYEAISVFPLDKVKSN